MKTTTPNTLQNHTLVYDKDCPMCCVYTKIFMKTGILDENGRTPFGAEQFSLKDWDYNRAQNEIALINRSDQTVTYGIDSMFKVVGHRFKWLNPLFRWKPFYWFMKKLYSFISYNRKVIAPPPKNPAEVTCTPDVNLKYRWLYIIFAIVMAAGLCAGALLNIPGYEFIPAFLTLSIIITLRFTVQMGLTYLTDRKAPLLDYLGNLATVNLVLAALVAPIFIAVSLGEGFFYFIPLYLVVLMYFINRMHVRRLKSLKMTGELMGLWVLQWLFIPLVFMLILTA